MAWVQCTVTLDPLNAATCIKIVQNWTRGRILTGPVLLDPLNAATCIKTVQNWTRGRILTGPVLLCTGPKPYPYERTRETFCTLEVRASPLYVN